MIKIEQYFGDISDFKMLGQPLATSSKVGTLYTFEDIPNANT